MVGTRGEKENMLTPYHHIGRVLWVNILLTSQTANSYKGHTVNPGGLFYCLFKALPDQLAESWLRLFMSFAWAGVTGRGKGLLCVIVALRNGR